MWIEIVLVIIAIFGNTFWLIEVSSHRKTRKELFIARAMIGKSAFARRQAKQAVALQERIKPLVKNLEKLGVSNEKKREAVLKLVAVKVPGTGTQVCDDAIKGTLKEIRR